MGFVQVETTEVLILFIFFIFSQILFENSKEKTLLLPVMAGSPWGPGWERQAPSLDRVFSEEDQRTLSNNFRVREVRELANLGGKIHTVCQICTAVSTTDNPSVGTRQLLPRAPWKGPYYKENVSLIQKFSTHCFTFVPLNDPSLLPWLIG